MMSIRTKVDQEAIIATWRQSLGRLLHFYDRRRGKLKRFFPRLFIFFVFLNITCYWWAIVSAYPEAAFGEEKLHYFLIQFPVGLLGALFDTLSFFITVYIAKKALKTISVTSYLAHLSVDIIIAIIATWWVLFVFSFSGWLVSFVQHNPESFTQRSYVYEQRLTEAITNPTNKGSLKNIYFGFVVGISAMLPTFTHLFLSVRAIAKNLLTNKN
ncbi:MAG: hypothetical protein WBG70_14005 [Spirulinaceae cyanobacterium]